MNLPNAQIIPLFGANGAGKSTLIRAIRDSLQAPAKHRAAVQKYQKTWEIEDVEKEIQSGTWKGNTIRNELERIDTLDTLTFEYDEESLCGGIAVPKKPIALYSYCNSQDNLRRGSHDKLESVGRFFSFFESQHLSEGQTIMYSLKDFINGLISDKEAHKENQNILLLMDEFDSGLSIENVIYLCRRMQHRTWQEFQNGAIRYYRRSEDPKARIGMSVRQKNGLDAVCVEYHSATDLAVRFPDGKTASHRTWDHFTHGAILHPLFTTYNGSSDFYGYTVRRAFEDASDKVFYRCVDNRTGEKSIRTLEELIPKDRLKKTAP